MPSADRRGAVTAATVPDGTATGEPQRLQKVLAAAGIGSRRACEDLIFRGRVTVDGRRAELGDRVDALTSVIHVDGQRIQTDTNLVYLAMNKPQGVVSTMADEKGRIALSDLLGHLPERVFHVGRLDADSEGLLLLTNDGDLAHKLSHPSFEVAKTYRCEIQGPVPRSLGRRLMAGLELEDGPARVDEYKLIDAFGKQALIEVVLHEGRKHIVRRLLAEAGNPVNRLIRTAIGPIRLGDLRAGRTRRLSVPDVAALFKAAGG